LGYLQPSFINFDAKPVRSCPDIAGPELGERDGYAIVVPFLASVPAETLLFVVQSTRFDHGFDQTFLSSDIPGNTIVADGKACRNDYRIAGLKYRLLAVGARDF